MFIINYVLALFITRENYNYIILVIYKFIKRVILIFDKIIYLTEN